MAAMVRGSASLPGALCRGRTEWDYGATMADRDVAIAICRRCPELGACRRWMRSLPKGKRPVGVIVAGKFYPPKPRKTDGESTHE